MKYEIITTIGDLKIETSYDLEENNTPELSVQIKTATLRSHIKKLEEQLSNN